MVVNPSSPRFRQQVSRVGDTKKILTEYLLFRTWNEFNKLNCYKMYKNLRRFSRVSIQNSEAPSLGMSLRMSLL